MWRISFAQARPMPAIRRWSRSMEWRRRESEARIGASDSASSSSASGPRCASSAASASGRKSQTPARFFLPASVSTSSPPSSKRSRNAGVFGALARRARGTAAARRSSDAPSARARRRRSGAGSASRVGGRPPNRSPVKRSERRIERLQRRDMGRAGLLRSGFASRSRRAGGARPRPRAARASTLLRVDPIRVTVQRGGVTESVHRVHVRTTEGVAYGDDVFCFLRSSAKPIQAIPLLEAYDDLSDEEIAIACASHNALPAQLDGRAGLARARRRDGRRSRVRAAGGPPRREARPQLLGQARRDARRLSRERLAVRGLPACVASAAAADRGACRRRGLRRSTAAACRRSRCRFPSRRGSCCAPRRGSRLRCGAWPELISWEGGNDAQLMRLRPGWIAKAGAEGLFCAASPDGVGIALKVEDGAGSRDPAGARRSARNRGVLARRAAEQPRRARRRHHSLSSSCRRPAPARYSTNQTCLEASARADSEPRSCASTRSARVGNAAPADSCRGGNFVVSGA